MEALTHEQRLHFQDLCRAIIDRVKDGYAKAYAAQGIVMADTADKDALKIQALYILNNLHHWRGVEAKQVKHELKGWG